MEMWKEKSVEREKQRVQGAQEEERDEEGGVNKSLF